MFSLKVNKSFRGKTPIDWRTALKAQKKLCLSFVLRLIKKLWLNLIFSARFSISNACDDLELEVIKIQFFLHSFILIHVDRNGATLGVALQLLIVTMDGSTTFTMTLEPMSFITSFLKYHTIT